jgi:hypothetical protein
VTNSGNNTNGATARCSSRTRTSRLMANLEGVAVDSVTQMEGD